MTRHVEDAGDAELDPYRLVAQPDALARTGLFVVEGRLVLPRLLASRYRVHSVLLSEAAHDALRPLLAAHPGVDVFVAPQAAIDALGGFKFHRGCLALGYRGEPGRLETELAVPEPGALSASPVVILEGVTNPDNIGGIFRSAHAFDARGIVLGPRCGDPLYRKAIRTSMGTSLQLPWVEARDWPAAIDRIRARGYRVIALTTDSTAPPIRDAVAASSAPIALLLGSEGFGLSPEALGAADTTARIRMPNADADSLNVTAAASIAMYEVRDPYRPYDRDSLLVERWLSRTRSKRRLRM